MTEERLGSEELTGHRARRMFNVAAILLIFSFLVFLCQLVNLSGLQAEASGLNSLPVSIRATSQADYSRDARIATVPHIDESILQQIIMDLPGTGVPYERMGTLQAVLSSPVPTMTSDYRFPATATYVTSASATSAATEPSPTARTTAAVTLLAPTRTSAATPTAIYFDPTAAPSTPTKTPKAPTKTATTFPTRTRTPTRTSTSTMTMTATGTNTVTPTGTATATQTPTSTAVSTFTPTPTATQTLSPTATPTVTDTPTLSHTSTHTATNTPSQTATLTATWTPTATQTPTWTPSPTLTPTATASPTATQIPSPTASQTPTLTPSPTLTGTATFTKTATASATATETPSPTASATPTFTSTPSHTPTLTATHTSTASATPTATSGPGLPACYSGTPNGILPSDDTYIEAGGLNPRGSDDRFEVRPDNGSDRRGLLKFDLSHIPQNATVSSATLYLYERNDKSGQITHIYRVTSNWNEGTATWLTWLLSGGDFDNSISYFSYIPNQKDCMLTLDITSLVQAWLNGTYNNHGIMLYSTGSNSAVEYSSKENSITSQHPKLNVIYSVP